VSYELIILHISILRGRDMGGKTRLKVRCFSNSVIIVSLLIPFLVLSDSITYTN